MDQLSVPVPLPLAPVATFFHVMEEIDPVPIPEIVTGFEFVVKDVSYVGLVVKILTCSAVDGCGWGVVPPV